MRPLLAACGGFLFAVLWFDLMFDTQVLAHATGDLPEPVLALISGYYLRVTTEAAAMSRLIAIVMLVGLAAAVYDALRGRRALWRRLAALVLLFVPVALAGVRVFPDAVRLGSGVDSIAVQSDLARAICLGHLLCIASIGLFVLLQILPAREARS